MSTIQSLFKSNNYSDMKLLPKNPEHAKSGCSEFNLKYYVPNLKSLSVTHFSLLYKHIMI